VTSPESSISLSGVVRLVCGLEVWKLNDITDILNMDLKHDFLAKAVENIFSKHWGIIRVTRSTA